MAVREVRRSVREVGLTVGELVKSRMGRRGRRRGDFFKVERDRLSAEERERRKGEDRERTVGHARDV